MDASSISVLARTKLLRHLYNQWRANGEGKNHEVSRFVVWPPFHQSSVVFTRFRQGVPESLRRAIKSALLPSIVAKGGMLDKKKKAVSWSRVCDRFSSMSSEFRAWFERDQLVNAVEDVKVVRQLCRELIAAPPSSAPPMALASLAAKKAANKAATSANANEVMPEWEDVQWSEPT